MSEARKQSKNTTCVILDQGVCTRVRQFSSVQQKRWRFDHHGVSSNKKKIWLYFTWQTSSFGSCVVFDRHLWHNLLFLMLICVCCACSAKNLLVWGVNFFCLLAYFTLFFWLIFVVFVRFVVFCLCFLFFELQKLLKNLGLKKWWVSWSFLGKNNKQLGWNFTSDLKSLIHRNCIEFKGLDFWNRTGNKKTHHKWNLICIPNLLKFIKSCNVCVLSYWCLWEKWDRLCSVVIRSFLGKNNKQLDETPKLQKRPWKFDSSEMHWVRGSWFLNRIGNKKTHHKWNLICTPNLLEFIKSCNVRVSS